MAKDRDVLAELASVREYLVGLIGDDPQPGQDANAKRLEGEYAAFYNVAENVVELAAVYASGVTHEDRLRAAGQLPDEGGQAAAARIAELEAQLEEARAASNG
jgi:hypothetical protein